MKNKIYQVDLRFILFVLLLFFIYIKAGPAFAEKDLIKMEMNSSERPIIFGNSFNCSHPKKFPRNGIMYVPKNEPITLMFKSVRVHDGIASPCSIIVTIPVIEKDYKLQGEHVDKYCSVSVWADNGYFPLARVLFFTKRQKILPVDPNGPFCKENSKFKDK